jgi:hypothetical protein
MTTIKHRSKIGNRDRSNTVTDAERARVSAQASGKKTWHRWGPYLSERQWDTVREDYSSNGEAWDYFSHDQARSRTYRWGEDARLIQRQALAGMIWSKQFYYYDIPQWLDGDPGHPTPQHGRRHERNSEWRHLNNADIISMPDKWEYPWYATSDLAFHCVTLALVDPDFAKRQLLLMTRVWYMHPNGQIPAYQWAFGDVNPPVHAWAVWEVYRSERDSNGDVQGRTNAAGARMPRSGRQGDLDFLERELRKLILNFTCWVNRKDADGNNIFQGGFLGLDNIGVFDRSAPLPTGGHINQANGTSWMAMYCLNLMRIALELAQTSPTYEDIATKFFEHFLYIAASMNNIGDQGVGLWDEEDQFYYDVLRFPDGELTNRLTRLFRRDKDGRRPMFGNNDKLQNDPHFRDYLLFHEYFHGDSGRGIGASHQTGWTGLVATLLTPCKSMKTSSNSLATNNRPKDHNNGQQ